MSDLTLIIPAAGRGSRFSKQGIALPKPLIDLAGKPFFWWATESVRRCMPIKELIFVILEEHIQQFNIDKVIYSHYPNAKLVVIPEVTKGAAETALLGIKAMKEAGPIAINDCDHAFKVQNCGVFNAFLQSQFSAGLVSFKSNNPAYSYAILDEDNQVKGTIEKQAVSEYAIAGCYLFNDSDQYQENYQNYTENCSYNEFFISGVYNELCKRNQQIMLLELQDHCSFGTPEEYELAQSKIKTYFDWMQ